VDLQSGYGFRDTVTGNLRGESPSEEPSEEKPGGDGEKDPGVSLVDSEGKEELLQPVDEKDECSRPKPYSDAHQSRDGEEPTHLPLGQHADSRETADALQRLGHVSSGYSELVL
jgi:hypothetical protein